MNMYNTVILTKFIYALRVAQSIYNNTVVYSGRRFGSSDVQ